MQKIQIIGNLGRDAETRQVGADTVISFSVAVTESWNDKNQQRQERTTWYECDFWKTNGQSSRVADYLKQGTKVYVEGKPEVRAYINNRNEPVGQLKIRVQAVELLGDSKNQVPAAGAAPGNDSNPAPIGRSSTPAPDSNDNDLPF